MPGEKTWGIKNNICAHYEIYSSPPPINEATRLLDSLKLYQEQKFLEKIHSDAEMFVISKQRTY